MLLIILILALVLLGGGLTAYFTGMFKIEKVEVEDENPESEGFLGEGLQEQDSDPQEERFDLDDGVSLKEKMDVGGSGNESAEIDRGEDAFGSHDRLTNLPNGRGYLIQCQKRLDQAKEEGEMFVAAVFDFDRFRFINSLKGVSIGDYVLTRVSQEMPGIFPEGAKCSRISADHFAVFFPLTDNEMFDALASKLKDLCNRIQEDIGMKSGMRLCIGFGITESLERDYHIQVLQHKANIARHCIKSSRNETHKIFEDTMVSSFLYGESAMDDYNDNQFDEDFTIYYAPQVDFALSQVGGCNAWTRWNCENPDAQPPAEKSILPTNGKKIIYQACRAMNRWKKAGKQIRPVFVSVSPIELYKEDIDEFIAKCLSEFGLEPGMLVVTIEAAVVRMDWASVYRQVNKLVDMGVGVAVDEIDVGYQDLSFLEDMKVNYVVLHKSFARKAHRDPERLERAKRMVECAKSKSIKVIFDGVDGLDQAEALKSIGARGVQGYYGGRPMLAEDFSQVLSDYVEKQLSKNTVILDDLALNQGDFQIF